MLALSRICFKNCRQLFINYEPNMENTSVQKLKHLRYKEQRQGKLTAPVKIDINIVASGSYATNPAVYVDTDFFKYLFNCGEGTQRLCIEHKSKITRLENILITHKSWKNIGGLLGMSLTIENCNVPKINLHGPSRIEKLFKHSTGFAQLHKLKIERPDLKEDYIFKDEAMEIYEIPIFSSEPEILLPYDEDELCLPSLKNEELKNESTSKKNFISSKELDASIVYICKPLPKPRAIDLEKCLDIGLNTGPLIAKLKQGENIELENGRIINPEQVLTPSEPINSFMIVECPSEKYFDSLFNNEKIKLFFDEEKENHISLVIHFTERNVLRTDDYKQWMKKFGSDTCHIVMRNKDDNISHEGISRIQHQTNMIDSNIFPLLPMLTNDIEQKKSSLNDFDDCKEINIVEAKTNLVYTFRCGKKGSTGLVSENCVMVDANECKKGLFATEDSLMILNKTKEEICGKSKNIEKQDFFDPVLTFLGTGSSLPNKVRNVSAILLQASEFRYILMDCGEGTFGQLYRFYGKLKSDEILQNLSLIFISHMHADHHMGIFEILIKRREAFKLNNKPISKLSIIAPSIYRKWLNVYNKELVNDYLEDDVQLHFTESLNGDNRFSERNKIYYDKFLINHNLQEIETVPVIHRQFPYALVLHHKNNWKLVYSGDTMPCNKLAEIGQNCDILIHEATMENELADDAAIKRHSTTEQAVDIGKKMNAKFTLLTHFSQRYAKIPKFDENDNEKFVGVAFDNMTVKFSQLNLLPILRPALRELFKEEIADLNDKTYKREMKRKINEKNKSKAIEEKIKK